MAEAWNLDRTKILSVAEVSALLEHLRQHILRREGVARDAATLDELIVVTLLLSGLRSSEFCELRVRDAAWRDDEPHLLVGGDPPAGRAVFVPRRVAGLIGQYVGELRRRCVPTGVDPEDVSERLVFSERRRPFERTGLYRRVVRILTEAGFGSRASVQLLRHTYGYLAYLRTGGNLLFVQRQLGHAHPRFTAVYADLVDESYAALAEQVAAGSALEERGLTKGPPTQCRPPFDCEID